MGDKRQWSRPKLCCYREGVLALSPVRRWYATIAGYGWPGRWLVWLVLGCLGLAALRLLGAAHVSQLNFLWYMSLCLTALCGVVLLWRVIARRLLWRVRNRLLVTYLLLGLAPIILFGTLTIIAGYLFAGQYATNTALRSLEVAAGEVRSESGGLAMLSMMNAIPQQAPVFNGGRLPPPTVSNIGLAVRDGNTWRDLIVSNGSRTPHSSFAGRLSPPWLQSGFQGLVDLDGQLYLCSETGVTLGSRSSLVLASLPLTAETLRGMATGLGRITIAPGKLGVPPPPPKQRATSTPFKASESADDPDDNPDAESPGDDSAAPPGTFRRIGGGSLPPTQHLLNTRVLFSAPILVQNWDSGATESALVLVASRPSLLYARLFATSVKVGDFVRIALLSIAGFVLIVELVAVVMAVGLSRTITCSVAALYKGTNEIDSGNLAYRVPIDSKDQLGALATSFNNMTHSMQELMKQQREKERLESELSIAQDVQRTLFPVSPLRYGGIEVHAVCVPARAVSGDYFDFFADEGHLCFALGDISGKGMSAALLMASLHAAVRSLGLSAEAGDSGTPSSARLFGMLNRQLLQSTQPERYATLFLAFYNRQSRRLTYTNGGHLAPWLLSGDGSHRALDRGGPVVGLLDGVAFEEALVDCCTGDLLVAYSDGLTEAENEFGEFGEARLLAFISEHRHLPLEDLAARTVAAVQAWIGTSEQVDDMTVLLGRVS